MNAALAWRQPDGAPVSCPDKVRMLNENMAELRQVMQDAFEDAVLMGVDAAQMRQEILSVVAGLKLAGY